MFSINQVVCYSSVGVCKIIDICTKKFNEKQIEYYVLSPIYSNTSTIYIPTQNEKLVSKINKILSKNEAYKLLDSLSNTKEEWIEDNRLRQEKFKTIINNGDRHDIISLINEIYVHEQECINNSKKLHNSDKEIMKEAEKIIYEEFAVIFDIDLNEVVPFIVNYINKSKS